MQSREWINRIAEIELGARKLPEALAELEEQQRRVWPDLRQGIEALKRVEYRQLRINGTPVLLQHNPRRIVSSSAKVDQRSIAERPCFLCPANMPEEEQGIPFGNDFVLVFNPMPVLESHIVAVSREHIPQRIAGHVTSFLGLIDELGEGFAVIYNGPRCGASAPDHLHFQAVASARLPLVNEENNGNYPVRFVLVTGNNDDAVERELNDLLETLSQTTGIESGIHEEPMINLLGTMQNGTRKMFIFPRSKHRPQSFFKRGDDQRMISPAALDLAGVVVAPRHEDFERLTEDELAGIFDEVTLRHLNI